MKKLNLQFHDELNQDIWVKNKIKPEVKKTLLSISKEFLSFLSVKVNPTDIVVVGSLTNYNYTPESDIDLHIIVDFSEIGDDVEMVKDYFDAKKFIWNTEHDIKIYGYEIEIYVQGTKEENASESVYSLYSGWKKTPSKSKPTVDKYAVLHKARDFAKRIEMSKGNLDALKSLKTKLKSMRKSGLSKAGEFSVENLAFKALRNSGDVAKLMKYAKEEYDAKLSLKEKKNKL